MYMREPRKPVPRAQRTINLPGFERELGKMPRERRLRQWLFDHGIGLIDLCPVLGNCHKSYPGKVLISCVDRLPDHQREALKAFGIPDDLLPPRTETKTAGRPKRENPLAF